MNDSLNSSLDLFQPDDFIPHDEKENFSHKGDILSPSRVVLATQALARTTPCGSASAKIRRKSALNTQFSSPLLKSNERQVCRKLEKHFYILFICGRRNRIFTGCLVV